MNTTFFWAVLLIVGAVGAVAVSTLICWPVGLILGAVLAVIVLGEPEPKQDGKTR